MKRLTKKLVLTLLPVYFLLLLVLPVFANGVTSPISDVMTVYAPDGSIFAQTIATEASEVANGAAFFYTLPSVAVDTSQFGNFTMLYEPGGNATDGPWSDWFGIVELGGTTTFQLAFASDDDTQVFSFIFSSLAADTNLLFEETGAPYDMTMYLSPGLQAAGYTAKFVSDVPVPEPSTILLLGAGLAGVGLFRRKLRK